MSKAEAINALMDSAITVFSEAGYEGASLRDIAAGAGVPLSTINMYFGTKADLYIVVMARLWREIETDRAAILNARNEAKGGKADLRDLIFALVKPVVDRARSETVADRRLPRLLRQWVSAPPDVKAELRRRNKASDALGRWIGSVMKLCPTLSKSEAVWGFSFVVGAMYSWEMTDNRYNEIVGMDDIEAQRVVEYLVDFAAAGMQGLISRSKCERPASTSMDMRP